jgi:hypothetical protein
VPGVVHVPVPRFGQLGPFGGEDLEGVAVLKRQGAVLPRLCPPQLDELLQLLGLGVGEVVALAGVFVGVEQFPARRARCRARSGCPRPRSAGCTAPSPARTWSHRR